MSEAANKIVSLYNRHAHRYDALRGKSLFERPWLDRFLDLVSPSGRILDLGCGTGDPIAGYFILQKRAVHGVDSSPEMIALCRQRFPDQTWQVENMTRLSLVNAFDGIIAWDSFFHLTPDDQRLMFPMFQRHARSGAPLLFTSGPQRGEAIGTFEGEPLYHGSLDPQDYRDLLRKHGFVVREHVANDPTCTGHTIWLAQAI